MITAPAPLLTERDHAILFGLARQGGLHTARYSEHLRDKLQSAVIIPLDAVEPDLATLGSLVRYRADGGRALEHKLMLQARPGQEHETLSVKTLRGLALLGMREGQIAAVRQSGDGQEVLELEMILFQPEADGELARSGSAMRESPHHGNSPE